MNELHNHPVKPDTYEASMARNQLLRIGQHAVKLHNLIKDEAEMEGWVAKKIDLAGDYVKSVYNYTQGDKAGFYEDAGEGHMAKSTLYTTAKYSIRLLEMIKPGDDLEAWVQSKLNKAADYLQGAYNYEEYQKLNPYREEIDSNTFDKHAQIVQKNIDEILAKETELDDIDTKPGMMRILAKRVNEVEKKIAKETRKNTDEDGMNEDPRAVGKALGTLKYGKDMADAIMKGDSIMSLKAKAQAYLGGIDDTIGLLDRMYPKQVNDDAAGVGIITKQNTTADVKPGDEYKNVKKLGLKAGAYESKLNNMLNKRLK